MGHFLFASAGAHCKSIGWSMSHPQHSNSAPYSSFPKHIPVHIQFRNFKFHWPLVHSTQKSPKQLGQKIKKSESNKKDRILENGCSSISSLCPLNVPLISTALDFAVFLNFLVSFCFFNSISMEGGSEAQEQKNVYSVWGLPPEDLRPRLKKLMEGLRSEFGGPEFEPHVTVVGAISLTESEARDKFKNACDGLKAYDAKVEKVATGTFFYQCVYLLLHVTPEVVESSDHCCGHFGYMRPTAYMPHLSLLYGDLSEEEKKKAQEKAYILDESIGSLEFKISRLALYKTDTEDKSLKSWEKVAECDLVCN